MHYRQLGRTEIQLSPLCLGSMLFCAQGKPYFLLLGRFLGGFPSITVPLVRSNERKVTPKSIIIILRKEEY